MTNVLLHRLCNYCLDKEKLTIGYVNIFDLNDDKLKRACEYHFKKHKRDCKHQGYINFGGFGFFIDSDHDKFWNVIKEGNKRGIKMEYE